MSNFLKKGDVIFLEAGHEVYYTVPKHFVYQNRVGDFSLTRNNVVIRGWLEFLLGRYVVVDAKLDGGSSVGGGGCMLDQHGYPDGWHVFCRNLEYPHICVDFYQSGCFTAMIKDIQPAGFITDEMFCGIKR